MARAFNGILGGFSGVIGPVVGCRFGDSFYLRSRPRKRSVPPTEKLLASRAAFRCLQQWLGPVKAYVQCGFHHFGTKTGGMRAAISLNYPGAVSGTYPDVYVNTARVRLSGGDLPQPNGIATAIAPQTTGSRLQISWWADGAEGGDPFDQAMPLAYNITKGVAVYTTTGAFRQTGAESLLLPGDWSGDTVHCWLAFSAADRSRQSESLYLGEAATM